ncbi:MAG: sigma-70 family RNA polymerase sigma factor [Solirubrobacterales bacterium]|nr:sigma-70 family RNA polymerase sigma factor [Solirubrobacterales bacterium]
MNPRPPSTARLGRISLRGQPDERLAELVALGSDSLGSDSLGSEAAFEAIVHRYRPALIRHCARLVGPEDADEAVQDTLLKAHRALARGTPIYSLGAWLHAIAHNSALSMLRRRHPATEYREEFEGGSASREISDQAERERLDALVSALLALPTRQRRALVMRELEGRSYAEIASNLEASNGAVRQLLNRARISIRERLATLIPLESFFRWASVGGGTAPAGATLAGSAAFAAKISSAIVLSAAPVVAVAPLPVTAATGASSHAARTTIAHARTVRVRVPAHRVAITGAVLGIPRTAVGRTVPIALHTVTATPTARVARPAAGALAAGQACRTVTSRTVAGQTRPTANQPAFTATTGAGGSGQPGQPGPPARQGAPQGG